MLRISRTCKNCCLLYHNLSVTSHFWRASWQCGDPEDPDHHLLWTRHPSVSCLAAGRTVSWILEPHLLEPIAFWEWIPNLPTKVRKNHFNSSAGWQSSILPSSTGWLSACRRRSGKVAEKSKVCRSPRTAWRMQEMGQKWWRNREGQGKRHPGLWVLGPKITGRLPLW